MSTTITNAADALDRTDRIVAGLIGGLTPEHRDAPTPCSEWTIHDLLGHMCSGGHMIAGALEGQAPPAEAPDYLADGPAAGWAGAVTHLRAAATDDALAAVHQLPFGEMPGEAALSVIVADHITHGWDLARASGQEFPVDDELAEWALQTWRGIVPAEGRTGPGFAPAIPVADDAPTVDRLAAYTGRRP